MGFDTQSALFPRLIDTVLGSAIAWFAVFIYGRIGNIYSLIK